MSELQLKLAVVDDEPEVVAMIAETMTALGCTVAKFSDATHAAKFLGISEVDGVVLDGKMPGMDGFALARAIRASAVNSSIPIAMFTGPGDTAQMRSAFDHGITLFLSKNATREHVRKLISIIRAVASLQKRRSIRVPLQVPVQCRWDDRELLLQAVNISIGGLLLRNAETLPAGKKLLFTLRLPLIEKELRVTGELIGNGGASEARVKFVDSDENVAITVKQYIDRVLQASLNESEAKRAAATI